MDWRSCKQNVGSSHFKTVFRTQFYCDVYNTRFGKTMCNRFIRAVRVRVDVSQSKAHIRIAMHKTAEAEVIKRELHSPDWLQLSVCGAASVRMQSFHCQAATPKAFHTLDTLHSSVCAVCRFSSHRS